MTDICTQVFRPRADGIHGTAFIPRRSEVTGGVMVIGGSGGSEPSYVAESLAAEGISTMSVAYFARPGLPSELRGIPLEYFQRAITVLQGALSAPGAPVVVFGLSRGSEAALLSAIQSDASVRGVVVTVPGNVVAGSWPPGGPAWLIDGQPLPYVGQDNQQVNDPGVVIPVEQVPAPILLVSAGADEVWPSANMARAMQERLRAGNHPFGHQLLEYSEAGHALGYLVPDLPAGIPPSGVTDRPVDQAARREAWPKTVRFVFECLRGS